MADYRTVSVIASVTNNVVNADGTVSTNAFDITADGQQVVALDNYIQVEQTDEGVVVTATDVRGTTQATIYNGPPGPQGNPGRDGTDGQDGFSPVASVSKVGDTATITITDANGTTTASVTDGTNGTNGQDGYSPVASVSKVGDTATITITDENGTTTASVSDGTNGTNGTNGADGFSPIATVSKVGTTTTISVTDENGTTTATVNDGTTDYTELENKPTKLSDFTDDLGSSPVHTHSQYLTSAPVTSVNGATGAVSGLAEDNDVVHLSGTESITGAKTFTKPVVITTDDVEGFNLKSSSAGGYLYVTRGSGTSAVQMAIKSGASGGTFGTNTNHQFQFRTNNIARMTVGTDGSVVIATDVAANSNNNQVATTKWVNSKFSGLATVATSGSYNDLSNKPTSLPTVSAADNGKVLRVVSGAWAAVELPSASGVNF